MLSSANTSTSALASDLSWLPEVHFRDWNSSSAADTPPEWLAHANCWPARDEAISPAQHQEAWDLAHGLPEGGEGTQAAVVSGQNVSLALDPTGAPLVLQTDVTGMVGRAGAYFGPFANETEETQTWTREGSHAGAVNTITHWEENERSGLDASAASLVLNTAMTTLDDRGEINQAPLPIVHSGKGNSQAGQSNVLIIQLTDDVAAEEAAKYDDAQHSEIVIEVAGNAAGRGRPRGRNGSARTRSNKIRKRKKKSAFKAEDALLPGQSLLRSNRIILAGMVNRAMGVRGGGSSLAAAHARKMAQERREEKASTSLPVDPISLEVPAANLISEASFMLQENEAQEKKEKVLPLRHRLNILRKRRQF